MQYNIPINQVKAMEWGLSLKEAALLTFIHSAAAWAENHEGYWLITRGKVIQELPILTDKKNSVGVLIRSLMDKGLIKRKLIGQSPYYRMTDQGKEWTKYSHPPENQASGPAVDNPVDNLCTDAASREKIHGEAVKNFTGKAGKFSRVSYNHNHIKPESVNADETISNPDREVSAVDNSQLAPEKPTNSAAQAYVEEKLKRATVEYQRYLLGEGYERAQLSASVHGDMYRNWAARGIKTSALSVILASAKKHEITVSNPVDYLNKAICSSSQPAEQEKSGLSHRSVEWKKSEADRKAHEQLMGSIGDYDKLEEEKRLLQEDPAVQRAKEEALETLKSNQ